jgi:septum site-determining protein MinD
MRQIDDEPRSITDLGPIPFDLDVMNSFGDKDFWDGISRSLYRSGLTKAWNRLATRLNLKNELPEMRISPLASSRLEEKLGLFSMRDRVLLLYGITLGAFGLGYAFMNPETISYLIKEPFRLASLIMGGIGILISLYVLLRLGQKPK